MAKIRYRPVPKPERTGKRQKFELLRRCIVSTEIKPEMPRWIIDYVSLFPSGQLAIYGGYRWDGASFFLARDNDKTAPATLTHDALYQLMREGLLDISHRKATDKLMYDILVENGIWKIEAKIWYRAVRMFSAKYARPKKLK